jgi:hypothetical protein
VLRSVDVFVGMQTLADVINLNISKWSSITLAPLKNSHLPKDALD